MLQGVKVARNFGGLQALKDFDFFVEKGKIIGLIGPNGAGKTTLFNVISGIYSPTSGKILFEDKDITGLKPYNICKLGIARTFQVVRLFLSESVLRNVMVGALFGREKSVGLNEARLEALRFLRIVGLHHKKDALASQLNLSDRKKVEIAMALNTDPKLVLLDEVVAGLNPTETLKAMDMIRRIRDEFHVTVFWVEHVMKAVMEVADHIFVIHHGEKIAEGKPEEVASDKKVIDAYLGETYEE